MHLPHGCLDLTQGLDAEDWLQLLQHVTPFHSEQHRALTGSIWNAKLDPHEEAIELRFRQREGADLVLRILRRDNKEGLREFVRDAIGGDVVFLHRFQQCALRFCGRAIYFINQHDLREERTAMKDEALRFAIEDGVAQDVRGGADRS